MNNLMNEFMNNLMNNFCKEVSIIEAQVAYTYQAMMENIHAETYSIMIDTFIQDNDEKERMFFGLADLSSVKMKLSWAMKWASDENASFSKRLVAFAIVEGLFFSGAFCAIYWIKQRNLLPGLTKSNEFIARDEGQHTEFACLLYNKLLDTRLPEETVRDMFTEAIAVETEFINESIPCRMIGMNPDLMRQYIECVADNIMNLLGYASIFGTSNPFGFMELIGMGARSNFFEERVSLYQKASVLNKESDDVGTYTEDF